MAEWFKDWFNSPEYLEVYKHRNEDDAIKLVELILKNVTTTETTRILDMACGAGRHSIMFAEKGFKVTAVDLSENLLSVGIKKAGNLPVEFIHSDIRKFNPKNYFDVIVSLFTSFGYFEEDTENFSLFDFSHNHLNKNGYFVFDYFNRTFVENNLVANTETKTDNASIIQRRFIENNRVNKEIIIKNGEFEKRFTESVKLYDKETIISELEKREFKILNVFGDYDGNCFQPETSSRIIIISQK